MLEIVNLTVERGEERIVNGVDLFVGCGEVVALCGVNGAGKSTLAATLVGLHIKKRGIIRVNGKSFEEMKAEIGFIPQQPSFMDHVKVNELLSLYRTFYDHPLSIEKMIGLGMLNDLLHKRTQHLSGGEKKRLAYALAMMGKPKLLIADEPTSGMDKEMRNHFYRSLNGLIDEGMAVLLITHSQEDIAQLAHKVITLTCGRMDDGNMVVVK